MCSTPDRPRRSSAAALLVLAALALGFAGGCAQQPRQAYTPPPMIVDGAMQRREFDRSVSWFPNGDTVSGVNRFPFRTDPPADNNEYGAAAYDIVASLAQTVALPFTYIFIPPGTKGIYGGENIGPTYTAMPPMRPPATLVNVDGLQVDRDTLEVRGAPKAELQDRRRYERHGATGMGDTDFELTEPADAPAKEWE